MVLAATPSLRSLRLPVELQTTDMGEEKSNKALLDCGATGLFASWRYVEKEQLNMWKHIKSISVRNMDGTLNEAGSIQEVLDVVLQYKGHSEQTVFAETEIGDQDLILELPCVRVLYTISPDLIT